MQTSQWRPDSSQTTWRSMHGLGAQRERGKGKIKGIDPGGELRKWGACKEKTHRNSRRNQIERRRGQSCSKQEKTRRPRRTVTRSRRVVWQRWRQREREVMNVWWEKKMEGWMNNKWRLWADLFGCNQWRPLLFWPVWKTLGVKHRKTRFTSLEHVRYQW